MPGRMGVDGGRAPLAVADASGALSVIRHMFPITRSGVKGRTFDASAGGDGVSEDQRYTRPRDRCLAPASAAPPPSPA